ncbi:MAG: 1-(5-phosphoribosyl)-5-[(5-phosphoribosylamino)methylideneamino]imidazole-4-carboxamide isomerase [Clostridia bacterium]|nr:1-(5-phosphoribosyl)-5-[(5-phosphoribosylamino)methylideneamino]imidazole-4-carboxamide isomerase [Clostridia bacterium]
MYIFPAIDLFDKKAVRLLKGNYEEMTVYSSNPLEIAQEFERSGAKHIHLVDLEGAKSGKPENLDVIRSVTENTNLFVEVGGGIRNAEIAEKYLSSGASRIILGTAAVEDEDFLRYCAENYKDRVAVGVDIKDGYVAVKGWTEKSEFECFEFCEKISRMGIRYVICTDISKDGAMQGTNHELYRKLKENFSLNITASGGISDIEDILKLNSLGIYGAIIGKAYYTGAINIKEAIEAVKL